MVTYKFHLQMIGDYAWCTASLLIWHLPRGSHIKKTSPTLVSVNLSWPDLASPQLPMGEGHYSLSLFFFFFLLFIRKGEGKTVTCSIMLSYFVLLLDLYWPILGQGYRIYHQISGAALFFCDQVDQWCDGNKKSNKNGASLLATDGLGVCIGS